MSMILLTLAAVIAAASAASVQLSPSASPPSPPPKMYTCEVVSGTGYCIPATAGAKGGVPLSSCQQTCGHAPSPPAPAPTPPAPPPPPTPGPPSPGPMPGGCYVDNTTGPVTYTGGNIFPYPYSVLAESPGDCCQKCHSFKNCSFWTYTCVGKAGKCCYLKDSNPHSKDAGGASDMSGSTKPLPVPPKLKARQKSDQFIDPECARGH